MSSARLQVRGQPRQSIMLRFKKGAVSVMSSARLRVREKPHQTIILSRQRRVTFLESVSLKRTAAVSCELATAFLTHVMGENDLIKLK